MSHHWVIAPADGPTSTGVCQKCREQREFVNYTEYQGWGDTTDSQKKVSKEVMEGRKQYHADTSERQGLQWQ